jgi:hypothetical protein
VANGQQFFDRINHAHVMAARFQQARHDGDRELLAAADQRRVDAVRALAKQADTVQDMFDLGKLLLDEGFQLCEREARLRVGQPCSSSAKIRSASLILGVHPGHRWFFQSSPPDGS